MKLTGIVLLFCMLFITSAVSGVVLEPDTSEIKWPRSITGYCLGSDRFLGLRNYYYTGKSIYAGIYHSEGKLSRFGTSFYVGSLAGTSGEHYSFIAEPGVFASVYLPFFEFKVDASIPFLLPSENPDYDLYYLSISPSVGIGGRLKIYARYSTFINQDFEHEYFRFGFSINYELLH